MPERQAEREEGPPMLGTWSRVYLFLLIMHAIVIFLFYLFTTVFNQS